MELAARGYRATGAEISPEFLDHARAGAAERGVAVDWWLGDMRRLDLGRRFDAALCFGNSSGYLEHAGTLEFLGALARHLEPGGRRAPAGVFASGTNTRSERREWASSAACRRPGH